ncbi:MAG: ABC transporter ATP-binding protein [Alphaproteobacteria bacterium]|nr:ABC transporter ATP-binding protein [Alphaproteobacteria bacterium]
MRQPQSVPPKPLLHIDGLRIAFKAGRQWREVVRGVDLSVAPGEVVGLVGESGSGKSLTALSILQVLPPEARIAGGRIVFDGTNLVGLSRKAMNKRRGRDIAMIFQDPLTALNPVIPVGRQIYDSLRTHQTIGHKAALERIQELLEMVGIRHPRERMRAYPHELSGGMRQRVMTALAISSNPKLLIADEPTTALDVTVQARVIGMLDRVRRDLGIAVLFISHNLELIAEICDRVSVMYAGKVVESSAVETVFETPRHPYTRQLLRCIPRLDGASGPMPTIPGLPPRFDSELVGCPFAPRCDEASDRCRAAEPPAWREPGHLAVCWEAA